MKERVYFTNRYQSNGIEIYAQFDERDIERLRMDPCKTEISKEEAFDIVRKIGTSPNVKLYGIAPYNLEHYDRRRSARLIAGLESGTVIVYPEPKTRIPIYTVGDEQN